MRPRGGLPDMRRFSVGSLSRNTVAALAQALVVSLCLFLVYRIVVSNVGLDGLGIWSLLMIGSTVARVGDLSGGAALARFIAPLDRTADTGKIADIVHTVTLTSLGIMVLMCGVLLAFVPVLLPLILPEASIPLARSLLPLVIAIIIVGGVSTVVMSGLDGFQRADQRAKLLSAGAVLMLGIAEVVVPIMGLAGFAWAQLISQLFVTLAGWALLRQYQPQIGWLPTRWRAAVFRETFSFGLKLNGIMVLTLLFEPLVKLALNQAGDTTRVALYELASRVVTQVRSLVVSAASPLMPAIAQFKAGQQAVRDALLQRALRITALAAVLAALSALVLAPVASWLVLGRSSPELLAMAVPLAFGWALHLPGLVFYLAAQADGRLRWNALSHLVLGFAVVIGLLVFAPASGVPAIIASVVVGLLASVAILLIGNAAMLGAMPVLRRTTPLLMAVFAAVSALSLAAYAVFQ